MANSSLHASQEDLADFAMLACMSVPPVRKISETILDFGEPLLSQLDAALPLNTIQSVFKIVITVWNTHVMATPRWGQPRFLADLHDQMRDPQMPPEMVEAMRCCRNGGSNGLRTMVARSANGAS